MIYTSLAMLAMSASALVSPFSHPFHLHPKMNADTRVSIALVNKSQRFREFKIAGHSYTVLSNQTLHIKAPAGTLVYAQTNTMTVHRGDVLLQLTPQVDHTQMNLD